VTTHDHPLEGDVAQAIAALGAAARRTYTTPAGEACRYDFGEVLTRVLAAVAANVGGVDQLLAGRPGSWEADGVRQLLTSTLGEDEDRLLEHRTEAVAITLYVDELMLDLGAWSTYDDATQELVRRYEAIGIPSVTGVPGDPATAAALAQLAPATEAQERAAEQVGQLEDQLQDQRRADWAAYGQALKAAVEAAAARREGLRVPVVVEIDTETFREDRDRPGWTTGIEAQLLDEAIAATPLPGNGRPPLDRLEAPAGE
jgi:hypothetical protein